MGTDRTQEKNNIKEKWSQKLKSKMHKGERDSTGKKRKNQINKRRLQIRKRVKGNLFKLNVAEENSTY